MLKKILIFALVTINAFTILFAGGKSATSGRSTTSGSSTLSGHSTTSGSSTTSGRSTTSGKSTTSGSSTVKNNEDGGTESVGVYNKVVNSVEHNVLSSVENNVYHDVEEDVYNGYGKYLKLVTEKGVDARKNFVKYFSDWQWSGQKQDFYTYSATRAEQERRLELCYDAAIKKFGIGTAIIATSFAVACFVPGGQIFHLSFLVIAKSATIGALSGAASGGIVSAGIALVQGKTGSELIYETVKGASDGYLIGAITGLAEGSIKAINAAKNATKLGETCLVFDKKVYDSSSKIVANFSKYDDKTVKALTSLVSEYSDDAAKSIFIKLSKSSDDVIKNLVSVSEYYGDDVGKALLSVLENNPQDFVKSVEAIKNITLKYLKNGIKNGLSLDEIASWDNLRKLLKNKKFDNRVYQELGKSVSDGSVLKRNYCRLLHIDESAIPHNANAHHIIPRNDGGTTGDKLRAILKKYSIDINDGHNCAILPSNPNIADTFGTMCHNGSTNALHGDKIMTELYSELSRAKSREQVYEILDDFRNAMLTNDPFWL